MAITAKSRRVVARCWSLFGVRFVAISGLTRARMLACEPVLKRDADRF
jgi:hypothetical protein